jgi:hypothetical protein
VTACRAVEKWLDTLVFWGCLDIAVCAIVRAMSDRAGDNNMIRRERSDERRAAIRRAAILREAGSTIFISLAEKG